MGEVKIDYTLKSSTGKPMPFTSKFTVTTLESHDIILGVGWFTEHDVKVDWPARIIRVQSAGRDSFHIRPVEVIDPGVGELAEISVKVLRKELKHGRIQELYAVSIAPLPDPLVPQPGPTLMSSS
jgi:hypothetical protein